MIYKIDSNEIENYKSIELCICICEVPYYDDIEAFDFLKDSFLKSVFSKLFIIIRDGLFVLEK